MATGKKSKRVVEAEGVAHVNATFNNTTVTITDPRGNTIAWGSSGKAGFKGSKKSTPFAATVAAEQCAREALTAGVKRVHVRVQGPGSGRESAISRATAAGLQGKSIKDVTPIPHRGRDHASEVSEFPDAAPAQRLPSWRAAESLSHASLYSYRPAQVHYVFD